MEERAPARPEMKRTPMWTLSKLVRYGSALLGTCIALFSYRYIAKLGLVPANVLANRFFDHWIIVHAGAASTALLIGGIQFSATVRQRWRGLHRACGWLYVASCIVGGVSGVVLAAGMSSGSMAAAGFGVLGTMWVYVSVQGLLKACTRHFLQHRAWMLRSYALAFAGVTLRIYVPISQIIGIDFTTAYACIAWLAWLPNLLVAEVVVRRSLRPTEVPWNRRF
jgi:hypothetical protein